MIPSVYCDAKDCKYWDGNCKADIISIDESGQCLGYEQS